MIDSGKICTNEGIAIMRFLARPSYQVNWISLD